MTTMRTGLTVLALALVSAGAARAADGQTPRTRAESASPGEVRAPAAAWAAVLKKAEESGEYTPSRGDVPASFSLADIEGPKDGDHQADYFTVFGHAGDDGVFTPAFVSIVSETWTVKPEDKQQVDQWLIRVDLDGALRHVLKIDMLRAKNGRVHRHERVEFAPEEGAAVFLRLVARFAGSAK